MSPQTDYTPRGKSFWVIGGEFLDTTFKTLREPFISGPFTSTGDAYDEWRRLTAATTARANVRYSITAET